MKLLTAALLIALAYLVELAALAFALFGAGPMVFSVLSFPLFFAGAMLTFAGAAGPVETRFKAHLDACLVLTGIGVTVQAFAVSVYFDVAALAAPASVLLPVAAALAGLSAMAVLARGVVLRLLQRPAPA